MECLKTFIYLPISKIPNIFYFKLGDKSTELGCNAGFDYWTAGQTLIMCWR